jgi:D-alanyl-D-alanine carboxypeptidase
MPRLHATIARISALTLAVTAVTAVTASAASTPYRPDRAELQRALDAVVRSGAPGTIVLVRDDRHALRLASGFGDLGTRRPMRPRDRVRVGSVTKTFVATVVLQLAAEGRLGLDDPIERRLPGLIPGGAVITIRQLLSHTSGLPDYADDAFVRGLFDDPRRIWAPRDLISRATSRAPLFAPGAGFAYSSTGYVALGLIVEATTGRPLADAVRRRIVVPLHLRATSLDAGPHIAGRHAHGYTRYHGARKPLDISDIGQSFAWAAGALVSTADDLASFYRALLGGRLLPPRLLAAMRPALPFDGQRWGLGLVETPHGCGPSWGHGGETLGYETEADSSRNGARQAIVAINADQSVLGTRRAQIAISRLNELAYCGSLARTGPAEGASARGRSATAPRRFVCVGAAQLWRRPGDGPIGVLHRGDAFDIERDSASGRWAFGTGRIHRATLRPRGWIRRSALCRNRPAGGRS